MRVPFRLADRPYLLLSLTSLFWAGNLVLGRFAAGEIPPLLLGFLRWLGASLFILPFVWKDLRKEWPAIRTNLPILALFSATGIAGYNALAYTALNHTEALNSLLIQSTGPLFIAVWCYALWGDRLTLRQLGGILTSLTGVVVIICRGDLVHLTNLSLNGGDLLVVLSLLVYGCYAAFLRKRPRMSHLSFLAATILGGAALLAPFAAYEFLQGARMHVMPATLGVVLYVALLPSLIAYLMFTRGVELIGANRASPFFHLMPVFGSVIAILFLGETPQLFHAIGFALVLSGVFVATTAKAPAPAEPLH